MRRVLVADQDEAFTIGLTGILRDEGYEAWAEQSPSAVQSTILRQSPDIVILSLSMTRISGLRAIASLRAKRGRFPIVVITERYEESEHVSCFRSGADDVIARPLPILEFIERIRVRLPPNEEHSSGRLRLDTARRLLLVDGHPIHLSPKEFDLLVELVAAEGRILSREALLESVWGITAPVETRTVEFHIKRLRDRLRPHGIATAIRNVPRRGFGWNVTDSASPPRTNGRPNG